MADVVARNKLLALTALAGVGALWASRSSAGTIAAPGGVQTFADAIARAEGFYQTGSVPQLANNPGALANGNIGYGVRGAGITNYPSIAAGWNALYVKLENIGAGHSGIYWPTMTIADMAAVWTSTQQGAWTANVAGALGVDPSTMIAQWVSG